MITLLILVSLAFALLASASIFVLQGFQTIRVRYYLSENRWRNPHQICYYIQFGTRRGPFPMGAGYIGGATAYLAFNAIRPWKNLYKTVPFQIGVTRKGSHIPYVQG